MLKTKELKTQICVQKSHHTNGLIQEFQERFDPIASYLLSCSPSPAWLDNPEFIKKFKEFEELVLDRRFDVIANNGALNRYRTKTAKLRQIDTFYEIFLETRAVLDLIQYGIPFETNAHLMRDYETAKLEGEAAGFDSSSKVAFVGCGPFPSTAVSYLRIFGSNVVCIDNNPEAVVLANKVFEKLDLQNKIKVVYGDGINIDYIDFTHVVAAGIAQPKDKILNRINQTARDDVRVVVRTTDGLRIFFYEPAASFAENLCRYFTIKSKVVDKKNIFHSLVLTRKSK